MEHEHLVPQLQDAIEISKRTDAPIAAPGMEVCKRETIIHAICEAQYGYCIDQIDLVGLIETLRRMSGVKLDKVATRFSIDGHADGRPFRIESREVDYRGRN